MRVRGRPHALTEDLGQAQAGINVCWKPAQNAPKALLRRCWLLTPHQQPPAQNFDAGMAVRGALQEQGRRGRGGVVVRAGRGIGREEALGLNASSAVADVDPAPRQQQRAGVWRGSTCGTSSWHISL